MKTYVLMVSRVFPAYHPRAGEQTEFASKILLQFDVVMSQREGATHFHEFPKEAKTVAKKYGLEPKLHTLRQNYDLWAHRAKEINEGRAVLSLRQWTGSPYNFKRDGSKQEEFLQLTKIGIQRAKVSRLAIDGRHLVVHTSIEGKLTNIDVVAKNDGLSVDDFCRWFPKEFDGCVIHFTDMRYR